MNNQQIKQRLLNDGWKESGKDIIKGKLVFKFNDFERHEIIEKHFTGDMPRFLGKIKCNTHYNSLMQMLEITKI